MVHVDAGTLSKFRKKFSLNNNNIVKIGVVKFNVNV